MLAGAGERCGGNGADDIGVARGLASDANRLRPVAHVPSGRLPRPVAAPAFLYDGDGVAQHGVDVEVRRVENVRVRRRLQRGDGALRVALVAAADVFEDDGVVGGLPAAAHFDGAALRPHFWRGGD